MSTFGSAEDRELDPGTPGCECAACERERLDAGVVSARRAAPDTRLVPTGEDDIIALRYIVNGSGGGADLIPWAQWMLDRIEAAPADPADAIAKAIYDIGTDETNPEISGSDWASESDFIKSGYLDHEARAVLVALGWQDAPTGNTP